MVRVATEKSGEGLKIVGLATERCHVVQGTTVRVHFRLSAPPPVGWPSIFGILWQVVQHPLKLHAGVEDDSIWIECDPEQVGPLHLKRLDKAVAQTNAKYRQGAQQQAVNTRREAQLDSRMQSQLDDLNRTLFAGGPRTVSRGSASRPGSWTTRLTSLFGRKRTQNG